jgi:hypothetical protein
VMENPTTEDEPARRTGLFCIGGALTAFFLFIGLITLDLPTLNPYIGGRIGRKHAHDWRTTRRWRLWRGCPLWSRAWAVV